MATDWDEFTKYYDWEFDLICTNQKKDVALWLELAKEFGDPILEVCCGSGRITLPLAQQGHHITALDISEEMLSQLRKKGRDLTDLEIVLDDMLSFNLNRKYKFAFIGYSSFQLLLTLDEQIKCLQNLHSHLEKDGILGLDICPTLGDMADQGPTHSYTAYHPGEKTVVSMYTACQVDRLHQIVSWDDSYEAINYEGHRTVFNNQMSLKGIKPDLMELLLRNCGFRILNVYGSFEKGPVTPQTEVLVYIAQVN